MNKITVFFAIGAVLGCLGGCSEDDKNPAGPGPGGPFPIMVSANFVPSGYMGDGAGGTALKMATSGCLMPRTAGAQGDCYKVDYTPSFSGWAGIYWQSPANNWGGQEGKALEPGATKVTFSAAAATDGMKVTFFAGGINTSLSAGAFGDTFNAKQEFTLTTAWQVYTIDLAGAAYGKVLGGFGWSMEGGGSTTPLVFYVDDIKWVK